MNVEVDLIVADDEVARLSRVEQLPTCVNFELHSSELARVAVSRKFNTKFTRMLGRFVKIEDTAINCFSLIQLPKCLSC